MEYVVDANVLSEPTKPQPSGHVVRWLIEKRDISGVTPIVVGELEYGILVLPASKRRTRLEHWFQQLVRTLPVLDFDARTASVWAHLIFRLKTNGYTMPIKDSLIAATALAHDLTVATRNTRDFQHAGVKLENPFDP